MLLQLEEPGQSGLRKTRLCLCSQSQLHYLRPMDLRIKDQNTIPGRQLGALSFEGDIALRV